MYKEALSSLCFIACYLPPHTLSIVAALWVAARHTGLLSWVPLVPFLFVSIVIFFYGVHTAFGEQRLFWLAGTLGVLLLPRNVLRPVYPDYMFYRSFGLVYSDAKSQPSISTTLSLGSGVRGTLNMFNFPYEKGFLVQPANSIPWLLPAAVVCVDVFKLLTLGVVLFHTVVSTHSALSHLLQCF